MDVNNRKDVQPFRAVIELTIMSIMGTSFKVRAMQTETVLDVKKRIYGREGIPVLQQHLVFNSIELENTMRLNECKLKDGSTVQLIPAMRGGPINFRRVPMVDDSFNNELAQLMNESMAPDNLAGKKPVAVIVLHDGTELHFFQFIDVSENELSKDDLKCQLEEEVKPEDTPEIVAKKEENAKTRSTMETLQKKMADDKDARTAKSKPLKPARSPANMRNAPSPTKPPMQQSPPSPSRPSRSPPAVHSARISHHSMPSNASIRAVLSKKDSVIKKEPSSSTAAVLFSANRNDQSPTQAGSPMGLVSLQSTSSHRSTLGRSAASLRGAAGSGPGPGSTSRARGTAAPLPPESPLRRDSYIEYQPSQMMVSGTALSGSSGSSFWLRKMVGMRSRESIEKIKQQQQQQQLRRGPTAVSADKLVTSGGSASRLSAGGSGPVIGQSSNYGIHQPRTGSTTRNSNVVSGLSSKHKISKIDAAKQATLPMSAQNGNRCALCSKKLNLANGFTCRCGGTFCAAHRYPESHRCGYDFKTPGRINIARDNPKVIAEKLPKL